MTIASTVLQILIGLIFLFTGSIKLTTVKEKLPGIGVTGFENIQPKLIKALGLAEIVGALTLLVFSIPTLPQFPIQIAIAGFSLLMIGASYHHYKRKEIKSIITTLVLLSVCLIILWLSWQNI
jgi:hypothetical protein